MTLRVGVDVGGTFTKAVAVSVRPFELHAHAVVPTSHQAREGVSEGVAAALNALLGKLSDRARDVELVAFSTTQAMNALLEGDVATVGVIGIGCRPDLRAASRRTAVGDIALAPGRALRTKHHFIDATDGLNTDGAEAALDRLESDGCGAIAVSGAYAVDAPEHELLVAERARRRGLPTCTGHELSGSYGLELRTVSAAINASILPLMERTAGVVERVLHEAGVEVPLLVLRGDGGAMSLAAFRRTPSFSIGAGPAAGVAAALHDLQLTNGIVLECGGTSSNVSVVERGRTVLRTLRVMGRPTAVRAIDSWLVGAAGGSMARLGFRRIAEVGPRSAHIAGLPYACFADPDELEDATLEPIAPRAGDPESYAAVRLTDGSLVALTATCAANALGLVRAGSHAEGSRGAALNAFSALAERLHTTPERAARKLLDGVIEKIAEAVDEAARAHKLDRDIPIVALGGSGPALAGEVAGVLGRPLLVPENPEVLSSIGAALSLVRAEAVRQGGAEGGAAVGAAHDAERACVEAGAAPQTVQVETSYEPREALVRAVATGAVALERGAAERDPVDPAAKIHAAARALGVSQADLRLVASTEYFDIYSENGAGPIAVVDGLGSVPLAERAKKVIAGEDEQLLAELARAVDETTTNLGVASILPRVALICGSRILDLSEARRATEIVAQARAGLAGQDGTAVAVVWQ
jgi:N-methylhydantoinase A/oxoprolinase/acetone carboxylase beta subunit